MKNWIRIILGLVILQTAVFAVLHRANARLSANTVKPAKSIAVSEAALIGDETELRGGRHARYTLIEFGDYQCPACARRHEEVKNLLAEFPAELRFGFRHYPLIGHSFAMNCALTAERARSLGRFWETHDGLYKLNSNVSPPQVTELRNRLHLNFDSMSSAQTDLAVKRIQADMTLAESCSIEETPTFVLCGPGGQVLKLGDISQVETLLQSQ